MQIEHLSHKLRSFEEDHVEEVQASRFQVSEQVCACVLVELGCGFNSLTRPVCVHLSFFLESGQMFGGPQGSWKCRRNTLHNQPTKIEQRWVYLMVWALHMLHRKKNETAPLNLRFTLICCLSVSGLHMCHHMLPLWGTM